MAALRTKTTERPLRAYVDTSVFGGVHDDEFRVGSERFFRAVRRGAFTILSSEPLTIEIASAPKHVRAIYEDLEVFMEPLVTTAEAAELANAYLLAEVVPAASHVDALLSPSLRSHGPMPSSAGTSSISSSYGASEPFMP